MIMKYDDDAESPLPKMEPNNSNSGLKASVDEVGMVEGSKITTGSFVRLQPKPEGYEQMPIIFFDLDNTLYSKNLGVWSMMGTNIQRYFQEILGFPEEEARVLRRKFYLDYGLAVRGLIRHFDIDPQEYDDFVDGSLPLEGVLQPNAALNQLLAECEGSRRWIFTNAGLKHARRCLRLLGIEGYFEGIIFCDYCEPGFPAKPDRLAYERAQLIVEQPDPHQCYFVDDSVYNVKAAQELGWQAIHFDETEDTGLEGERHADFHDGTTMSLSIRQIEQLKQVFPKLFKQ